MGFTRAGSVGIIERDDVQSGDSLANLSWRGCHGLILSLSNGLHERLCSLPPHFVQMVAVDG